MIRSDNEISYILINQLTNSIETLIKSENIDFITEHQLIKKLQSPPYNLLSHLSFNQSDQLFQLHFLVFHSLYRLNEEFTEQGYGEIVITPLKIKLLRFTKPSLIQNDKKEYELSKAIKSTDKLAEYYLNLKNIIGISPKDIDLLILSFWQEFHHPNAHDESLAILNLSSPTSYKDIKQQYKRLASKHHPDKGGSKEKLQQINQAMATLSKKYKKRCS